MLRVLIVEDEALVALEAEAALRSAGYDVVGVAEAMPDALALVDQSRPDVAVVDIRLAGPQTGLELASALRLQGIPSLIASGNTPPSDFLDAIGCLRKPYGSAQLVRAVFATVLLARGESPDSVPAELQLLDQRVPGKLN